MSPDFRPMIEPTPKLTSRRCRVIAFAIAFAFKAGAFILALAVWYRYDLFFAIAAFLVAYLVTGIVRAKIRNGVIPLKQQEYPYTDMAIATWYVVRRLLCEASYKSKAETPSEPS